jgi:hypothetical protein
VTVAGHHHVIECDNIYNGDAHDIVDAVGRGHIGDCVCVDSTAGG